MSVLVPLLAVVRRLGELRDRVVFVGGMIRGSLIGKASLEEHAPTRGELCELVDAKRGDEPRARRRARLFAERRTSSPSGSRRARTAKRRTRALGRLLH